MNGVWFGDKHSYTDFNLVLSSKEIPLPTPKVHVIDVPGADGQLDLTTSLTGGMVKYKNRVIKMVFTMLPPVSEWEKTKSNLAAYLHGKVMKVRFDVDLNYYYEGRCDIESFEYDNVTSKLTINLDAAPYKYDVQPFTKTITVAGTQTIIIPDQKMRVVPTINVSAEMQLEYKTKTHKLFTGDNVIPDAYLGSGQDNVLKFIGNGTVKITFTGGAL